MKHFVCLFVPLVAVLVHCTNQGLHKEFPSFLQIDGWLLKSMHRAYNSPYQDMGRDHLFYVYAPVYLYFMVLILVRRL